MVYIHSYIMYSQLTIFLFNTGDTQFIFKDGFNLRVYYHRQILLCQGNEQKMIFNLPVER